MKTVEAKATVVPMNFPEGTVPGPYKFVFNTPPDTPFIVIDSGVPSCTAELPAGSWVCTAQRFSEAGAPLGDEASVTFTIAEDATITIGVVGDLAVSVRENINTVKTVKVS